MSTGNERPTEPFREEHAHLRPHVEGLAEAADVIGSVPIGELRQRVGDAYHFLIGHLIPHATAEDEVLYPKVDELLGSRGETRATDTMRRDHVEVGRLTETLGTLRERLDGGELEPHEERELRAALYGLYAVVGLHFAKEEEVYLPLLDRELRAEEARELFEQMERVGEDVHSPHAH
jgi:iron-sulfur cluster repair protein YtfE (RIC family)